MSPAQKKTAVAHVVAQRLCSARRACRYLGLARSTYRYAPKPVPDRQQQLHQRIIALSWTYPRYGYRRIRRALAKEGWTVSRKQVQRIRRREEIKFAPSRRKYRGAVCPPAYLPKRRIGIMCGLGTLSLIEPTAAV